jgi:hypothetical protein
MVDNEEIWRCRCIFKRIYGNNDENKKEISKVSIRRDFALYFSITETRNCDCGRIRLRIWTYDSLFDSSRPQPDYLLTPSRIGLRVPTQLTPKGQNPDFFKAWWRCVTSLLDRCKYGFRRPTQVPIEPRCQNAMAKVLPPPPINRPETGTSVLRHAGWPIVSKFGSKTLLGFPHSPVRSAALGNNKNY